MDIYNTIEVIQLDVDWIFLAEFLSPRNSQILILNFNRKPL